MLDPFRCRVGPSFPIDRTVGERGHHHHEWSTMHFQGCVHPCQASLIRFRPKLHKPLDAASQTFTARPLVSTTWSVSRPIDKFFAVIVMPLMVKVPFSCNSTGDLLSRLRGYNDWFTNVFQQGETPLNRRRHAVRLQRADIVSLLLSVRWTPTVDACLWLYSEWYPWLVNYDAI